MEGSVFGTRRRQLIFTTAAAVIAVLAGVPALRSRSRSWSQSRAIRCWSFPFLAPQTGIKDSQEMPA